MLRTVVGNPITWTGRRQKSVIQTRGPQRSLFDSCERVRVWQRILQIQAAISTVTRIGSRYRRFTKTSIFPREPIRVDPTHPVTHTTRAVPNADQKPPNM